MKYGYGYFEEDQLGRLGDFSLWRRILAYVRPDRRGVLAAVLLSLVVIGASLLLPYLLRLGVDDYIVREGEVAARLAGLGRLSLVFAGVMCLGFVANFLQVTLLEWTGQNIMHRLRQQLFDSMLGRELAFFHLNPGGKLVTRLTNDIQNMHEMFTSVIVTVFNDFLRIVGILVILFWLNWRLALLISLLLPLLLLVTGRFAGLARDVFRTLRTRLARINAFLQEALWGVDLIQLYGRERETASRFSELNRSYQESAFRQITIFGIFMPVIDVLSTVSTGFIIWYGGLEILRGGMTIGVLVAFLSYMRLFFQPLRELSQKFSIVQSAMASAERIFELLDRPAAEPAGKGVVPEGSPAGRITFNNVTFGYEPDQPVLKDLSLTVAAGETLAVVGATGAGKTTLINLLEQFYRPDTGKILIDDLPLDDLDPGWLRQRIGLVMQEVYLVPGTIRENILLDRELSGEELAEIVDKSQLAAVIGELPDGLETRVGEGGGDLSAGQRQLLALARALAGRPSILVLDEATANIDSETEMRLEQAVAASLAGHTSIVIAHRLSTIRRADRIAVLAAGRLVEIGTHGELMARRGHYYRLQLLQESIRPRY